VTAFRDHNIVSGSGTDVRAWAHRLAAGIPPDRPTGLDRSATRRLPGSLPHSRSRASAPYTSDERTAEAAAVAAFDLSESGAQALRRA